MTVSTNDRSLPNHPNSKYNKRILLLNPPASAVEGIKSVPSVCVCVCVRPYVCLLVSALPTELVDVRT